MRLIQHTHRPTARREWFRNIELNHPAPTAGADVRTVPIGNRGSIVGSRPHPDASVRGLRRAYFRKVGAALRHGRTLRKMLEGLISRKGWFEKTCWPPPGAATRGTSHVSNDQLRSSDLSWAYRFRTRQTANGALFEKGSEPATKRVAATFSRKTQSEHGIQAFLIQSAGEISALRKENSPLHKGNLSLIFRMTNSF